MLILKRHIVQEAVAIGVRPNFCVIGNAFCTTRFYQFCVLSGTQSVANAWQLVSGLG